jgi:hypothetical protein
MKKQVSIVPKEAERVIQRFERAASERAIVGKRLRGIITGEPSDSNPDSLPTAIKLILVQIEALVRGEHVPLDPSLVGLAAIRTRYGGGAMGDCIMYSLNMMANATPEARALANYLWSVANGGPSGPAPQLTDTYLATTAEEVRCLADREVGGIRLLMMREKKVAG